MEVLKDDPKNPGDPPLVMKMPLGFGPKAREAAEVEIATLRALQPTSTTNSERKSKEEEDEGCQYIPNLVDAFFGSTISKGIDTFMQPVVPKEKMAHYIL